MSKRFKRPKSIGLASLAAARAAILQAKEEAYQLGGPTDAPALLYHYSTESAIRSILGSGTLWASDLRLMNDETEIKYASDVRGETVAKTGYLESVGKSLAEELRDQCTHIACLSSKGNREFQWENYADRKRGCAIAFRYGAVLEICRATNIWTLPLVYEREVQVQRFAQILMAAERIAKRVRERDRHGLHMEVLRGLGEMLYLAKNPRYAAELEWRLQVDHDNPQFKPVTHTDCACRRALPICGPATIAELILGPDCQMTVEEGQQLLARLKYESTSVRRIARDELIDEDAHIDEGARIAAR